MSPEVWEGVWSRPGVETEQAGTLTRDEDGMTLRLPGGGLVGGDEFSESNSLIPLIHGKCGAVNITLVDSFVSQLSKMRGGAVTQQVIMPIRALIGVHLPTFDSGEFRAAAVRIQNAHHWAPLHLVDHRAVHILDLVDNQSLTATVKGYELHAYLGGHTTSARGDRDEITETETQFVVFKLVSVDGLRPFDAFDDLIAALQDLLTLASDEPCNVLDTTLDHRDNLRFHGEEIADIPNTVRMLTVGRQHVATTRPTMRHEYAFTCEHTAFSSVVPAWVQLWTKARAACKMLLGLSYSPAANLELQLLQSAIPAEALHVALYEHDAMEVGEFAAWKAALLEITPKDRQQWVDSAIRNSPSFPARLRELADQPDQQAVNALIPDRPQWVGRVTGARNLLAHTATRGRLFDNEALNDTIATQYLLRLVLLSRLGISAERQRNLVRDGRTRRYLLQRQA
jgi:hypothetical protein